MRKLAIWVLLADATRARVVRYPARLHVSHEASLETLLEFRAERQPLRKIMADRPGRSFASTGARRSAMEYHSDPVRDEMRRFAASIISALDVRFARGEFDRLVMCAPPRMLSALREALPATLAASATTQIAKDFTKLPELEIHERLQRLARLPE
jgi:protein required for attachment to host cells